MQGFGSQSTPTSGKQRLCPFNQKLQQTWASERGRRGRCDWLGLRKLYDSIRVSFH